MLIFFSTPSWVEAVNGSVVIVENGASQFEILVTKNAVKGTKEAARELQRLVHKSTQLLLPIVSIKNNNRKQLVIGDNRLADQVGINSKEFESDAYQIKVVDENVFLVGKDDPGKNVFLLDTKQSLSVGSYYAVLDFARQFLGANWYMPGPMGEEVRIMHVLKIPKDLDVRGQPSFKFRFIDIATRKKKKKEEKMRKQGQLSGQYYAKEINDQALRWGRHLRLGNNFPLSLGHSWYKWLPAEKSNKFSKKTYGASNPEYYSKPVKWWESYYYGKGGTHGGQLCICNNEVVETVAENIIKYAKSSGERNFSLSPNDGKWECSCECCANNSKQFKVGTQELTAEVIDFSNRVVDKVVVEIPDAKFGFYAYSWTLNPPKDVKAREQINFSDVYNGLAYMFYKQDKKKETEDLILKWRRQVSSLVLTSYYTFYGHYSLPWSTLDVQAWLFDLFKKNNSTVGMRMNYALYDNPPMGILGADPWVLSELMWDSSQSVTELETKYYHGAFGIKAGSLIKEYFDTIGKSMAKTIALMPYKKFGGVKGYILPAYGSVQEKCRRLIKDAQLAVATDNQRIRWRVDRISRGWAYAEMTIEMLKADKNGDKNKVQQLMKDRHVFLANENNIFALAPAAADYQEISKPLVKSK